jgi:hypothetical protein
MMRLRRPRADSRSVDRARDLDHPRTDDPRRRQDRGARPRSPARAHMLAPVKATKLWRVRFSGTLDDGARDALRAAEAEPQDGAGARSEVLVGAPAPDVAIKKVRKALEGRGRYLDFSAEIDDDEG